MRKALLLAGLMPLTASIAAQEYADTVRLHEVEVIQKAKAPVTLLPVDLTMVTAGEIRRSTETSILPVLQNRVPGLYLTERGMAGYGVSGGSAGMVNIRGVGGGNKVLFMINGEPQWAGVFGHALSDTYTTSNVERVEVVSGPSSLLYGSNAMGGSVNIITRQAKADGVSGYARAMIGSYDTQKYNLNVGYKKDRFSAYFAGSYDRSNGTRENSQFWLANQYGSLQYRFSRNWNIGANFTLTETDSHNPGENYAPVLDGWARVFRSNASLSLHNTYNNVTGGMQVYWSGGRHKINDGHTADAEPREYLFRSTDYNYGLTIYENIKPWKGNNFSLGFDLKNWGGHTWYDYFSGDTKEEVDKNVTEVAGYAMMQQAFMENMLSINGGVRVENSSQFGTEVIPQAGFIFHAIPSNTLKFSFGKGYRCPNLRELYIKYYAITTPAGTFTGPCNPDLKPEYLLNYEVQLRQMFFDGKLDAGVSLYFIDGKNMIQNLKKPNGDPGMMWQNTGSFINKGFEIDANYLINDEWSVMANYAYLHTNRFIAYAPKNKLFAEIMYHPGNWEISLENMNIWRMRATETNTQNYSLLNARIAYNFGKVSGLKTRVFSKLDNITNTRYEIMDGYPMPGFTIMGGVELSF